MAEQISGYRLEGEIARGGMGIVYRAVHTVFEEVVAIKAIFPELTLNPELRARFVNEAKIQRRLQHPHIVQIREFLIEQDRFYIVMEFIEGETLAQKMKRAAGPLPADESLEIFRQALLGLGFAHAQGVIHRDMKPSNIMITREHVAKLTDFGIARAVGAHGLTRTGTALGTPAYMSPEQIQGLQLDHRSDIYSIGVTLYEMVAGRVPFKKPKDSDSDFLILRAHVEEQPPPPSLFVPTLPTFIETTILKAMAKRPADRFGSCEEFEASLASSDFGATERVITRFHPSPHKFEHAQAPLGTKPQIFQRAQAGARWNAILLLVIFVLATAIAVGAYWTYGHWETPQANANHPAPQMTQKPTAAAGETPHSKPFGRKLNIDCHFVLRKDADLVIFSGDQIFHTTALRRKTSTSLGLNAKSEGSYSQMISIPSNVGFITARVRTLDGSLDLTRPIQVPQPNGKSLNLHIDVSPFGLELHW